MSYKYDVFLSYPGDEDIVAWINEYFLEELRKKLRNYTISYCERRADAFFIDVSQIRPEAARLRQMASGILPGDEWQEKVQEAIRHSRCMVALCSPTYFYSTWCHLEMSSFLQRQTHTGVRLITPVSLYRKAILPAAYTSRFNVLEMNGYVIDGPSLRGSQLYPGFLTRIDEIADAVAQAVCGAPDFQNWPIVQSDPSLPLPGSRPPVRTAGF